MPVTKTCVVCATQFQVPPARAATATTCGRVCKGVMLANRYRESWVEKQCPECGKLFTVPAWKAAARKCCSKKCKDLDWSKTSAANPKPRSRSVTRQSEGYLVEFAEHHPYQSNGYVLQHRLVMERWLRSTGAAAHFMESLGGAQKYLRRDVEVHHRNEQKDDNRRKNLVVCTPQAHRAIHRGDPVGKNEAWPLDGLLVAAGDVKRKIKCTCKQCGAKFERSPSGAARGRTTFCSRDCYNASFPGAEAGMPSKVSLVCVVCGGGFTRHRSRYLAGAAKFCSNACKSIGLRGKPKRRKPVEPFST